MKRPELKQRLRVGLIQNCKMMSSISVYDTVVLVVTQMTYVSEIVPLGKVRQSSHIVAVLRILYDCELYTSSLLRGLS